MGDKSTGPGFWRTLDGVLGGQTVTQVRDGYSAQQSQAEQLARVSELVQKISKGDPQLELLMRTNPQEATKALASRYQAANVGGGETRYGGQGGQIFTAPKMGVEDGVPYTQTPQGATVGAPLPVGLKSKAAIADTETDNARLAAEQAQRVAEFAQTFGLDVKKLNETIRANRAREGIDRARPVASGGGGGSSGGLPPGFELE